MTDNEQVERAYRAFCEARLGRVLTDAEHNAAKSSTEVAWIAAALSVLTEPADHPSTVIVASDRIHYRYSDGTSVVILLHGKPLAAQLRKARRRIDCLADAARRIEVEDHV